MKSIMPNEIKYENLVLRKLCKDDNLKIYEIRSNQDIAKYLDRPICQSLEEADNFITKVNNGISRGEYFYWGITLADENEVIGTISIWNISEDKTKGDIGFELLPEFRGKGIMTKSLRLIIDYAFQELNFDELFGEVDPQNGKSINLMKKHGFELFDENSSGPTVIYRLTKENYLI